MSGGVDVFSHIAERVVEAYEDEDPRLLEEARKAVLDTMVVAAAAPKLSSRARRVAESIASEPGSVPVLGLWRTSSLSAAVAANAFLAHSLELDDWLAPGYVHAGSVVVPVAIALAGSKPFKELLKLVVAGYEAAYLVGSLLGRNHYRVWHTTATAGSAAAAAVAVLAVSGRDPERAVAAMELALAYAGGLWGVNRARALYKPLSPAMAATRGLLAARVALVEAEPIPQLIEDVKRSYHAEGAVAKQPGRGIMLNGFKFYPACRHTHTAVEAAERLSRQLGQEGIRYVEVQVFEEAARVAGKPWPTTLREAMFSLAYLVAVALTYGRLGFEELQRGMKDPRVRRVYEAVRVSVDPAYTSMYPEKQPARVKVVTVDGRVLEEVVEHPRGDPARRPSLDELQAKAHQLAREAGDERVSRLARQIAVLGLDDTLDSAIKPLLA
jgi:2-methylcitrate dehydratase PrpD